MNNNTNKFDTCFTTAMHKILKGKGEVFFQGEYQQPNRALGLDELCDCVVIYTKGAYTSSYNGCAITELNLSQKYRMVTKEDL